MLRRLSLKSSAFSSFSFASTGGTFCFILFFETSSLCVFQASLELMILLLQSSKDWDYRHVPP